MSDGLTDANRDEKECRHGGAWWRECHTCVTEQERNDLRRERDALLAEKAEAAAAARMWVTLDQAHAQIVGELQARLEAMKAAIVGHMREIEPCYDHAAPNPRCAICKRDLFIAALVDEATKRRGTG